MRTLILAGFSDSVIKFRGPLINSLRDKGVEVHVGAPGLLESPGVIARLRQLGAHPHETPMARAGTNPISDAGYLWMLWAKARTLAPDFVLAYTVKPVIYGTLAAWLARVPRRYVLITGLGFAFTAGRRGVVSAIVRRMYRMALNLATKVFFQNPDDERLFRETGLLAPSVPSVVVNGSGVDVKEYSVNPFPSGGVSFLMIGRLLGDKGVREYAQAARRVRALHPQVRFRLVGWIDSNPDAISQSELDAWLAEGALEFLGRLDDVRPAIADSTVYVLPSYREGTPRTVLEAMAMGRPIITTDAPGCRETVVDGDNGFLVPVQSVDALVAAMLRFIEDPTLAKRMGRRSRQIAEEKYDVHKVNAVMLREMGIVPAAPVGENHAA